MLPGPPVNPLKGTQCSSRSKFRFISQFMQNAEFFSFLANNLFGYINFKRKLLSSRNFILLISCYGSLLEMQAYFVSSKFFFLIYDHPNIFCLLIDCLVVASLCLQLSSFFSLSEIDTGVFWAGVI